MKSVKKYYRGVELSCPTFAEDAVIHTNKRGMRRLSSCLW